MVAQTYENMEFGVKPKKPQKGDKDNLDYSVVVPVYNEGENVRVLHKEIEEVMSKISNNYEIIFINDGSKDDTLDHLKKLKNVKIINLNRNYGQSTAFDAGFKLAQGNIIISMDGDLQNDPLDIYKLLKKLEDEDLDVVAGWRKDRKDKSGIRILTKIGRFLRKKIIQDSIHDSGCALRVYKKAAIKSLDLHGEMHRYIVELLKWKGFKIGEVEVNHRPRIIGKTKYGYSKAVRGFIDLIYMWFINKYSQRPLHMFGQLGLWSFFISFLTLAWSVYQKLTVGLGFNRNGWFFLGIFSFLAGIMFFSFGIVMDLIIRTYMNTSPFEKRYYVRDVIVND